VTWLSMAVLSIENERARELDISNIAEQQKARKRTFQVLVSSIGGQNQIASRFKSNVQITIICRL